MVDLGPTGYARRGSTERSTPRRGKGTDARIKVRGPRLPRNEGSPVPEGVPSTPYLRVYQESALRAIIECQPYKLPTALYDEWKYFAPVFKEKI